MIVSGYDPISAYKEIVIYITRIRALALGPATTISMGVKLIYKEFGSVSSFFYGPRAYTPQSTQAYTNSSGTGATPVTPNVNFTGS